MEKVLQKLARQLNAYDEASLMNLWERYAQQVQQFEPTKRWEEATLMLGMIQALRWKNQLFNYHWAQAARPEGSDRPRFGGPSSLLESDLAGHEETSGKRSGSRRRADGKGAPDETVKQGAKVLRFRPREPDEPV